jgi:hypothetical protein
MLIPATVSAEPLMAWCRITEMRMDHNTRERKGPKCQINVKSLTVSDDTGKKNVQRKIIFQPKFWGVQTHCRPPAKIWGVRTPSPCGWANDILSSILRWAYSLISAKKMVDNNAENLYWWPSWIVALYQQIRRSNDIQWVHRDAKRSG